MQGNRSTATKKKSTIMTKNQSKYLMQAKKLIAKKKTRDINILRRLKG